MTRVTFDFETRSVCDLKKSGAYKYSLDPTTRPTCLAFKTPNSEARLLNFEQINTHWDYLPREFRLLWRDFVDTDYLFVAHNAFFETCIYKNILVKRYGWPNISFRRFRCTAAKAAACALPRNLAGAGEAMNLTTQKDKAGYIAMMQTCKPTKQWNTWKKSGSFLPEPSLFLEPNAAPQIFGTLYQYCKIDVVTEELLDQSLPDLIPTEQEVWFLNQQINWRGVRVDIPTIEKIVGIMATESKTKLKELDSLTMGLVTKPGARQSILDFLAFEGIELPDIKAKTVDDMLSTTGKLSPDMRRLLEIRKALSKTSTKKYEAFINRVGVDSRIRDILLYHGASTGRDSGTGVQVQNFPKGILRVDKEMPYAAVENVEECDADLLKVLYGENLSILFSSILRNMIIPSAGSELFVADFAKIEVAVLWWLSGNKAGLEVLNSGKDPYIYMAAANLGLAYGEVERAEKAGEQWAIDARQLGKAQVLGCGFGMGWPKFLTTAWDFYRLQLTDEQAKDAVSNYRETNDKVPELWDNYEQAAIRAIEDGVTVTIGKCKFFCKNDFLWIKLPSGRPLAYRKPQIAWRVREFEVDEYHPVTGEKVRVKKFSEPKKTIEFWAVNSKIKKWGIERTWGGTLTENIVQACARDLMAEATLRLEKTGYKVLLTVHDEIITEYKRGAGNEKEFKSIMCSRPLWADKELPLDAKAWVGPRYRK